MINSATQFPHLEQSQKILSLGSNDLITMEAQYHNSYRRAFIRETKTAASTLSLWVLSGWRGAWEPCIYKVYLVYRELCHLVQYACPIVLPLISGR